MNSIIFKVGFISFFSDLSSELLYPITPVFLTSVVQASMISLGVIEGVAQLIAALLNLKMGQWSDESRKRKPFVISGYLLATLSKGIIGFSTSFVGVFTGRILDRAGKGIRTAPRDAIIVDTVPREQLGFAFGVHRGMDTLGAVLGPLAAYFLITWYSVPLPQFYFYSVIPGMFAVFISFSLPEAVRHLKSKSAPSPVKYSLKELPRKYYLFLLAWSLFSISNSSDAFLIMKANINGGGLPSAILYYCFFNLIYAISSPFLGKLSDDWGRKKILLASLIVFAIVYFGFAVASAPLHFWFLFGLYGLFMGMSEGIGKALIASHVPPEMAATGIGLFGMTTGICALIASIAAGLLWDKVGPDTPFIFGGIGAIAGFVVFKNLK